ncbi:hypothetical protein [Peribacillus simplex]|uniref:hypothetical protein n=1 Tax=Peribacillus simplex TaxID=1478 RepID=UPI000A909CBB|nr:hypothetical protein [Peribacillus simplex]
MKTSYSIDEDYLPQQLVVSFFENEVQNMNRLHLMVEHEPVENTDSWVGEKKGRSTKLENTLHLLSI